MAVKIPTVFASAVSGPIHCTIFRDLEKHLCFPEKTYCDFKRRVFGHDCGYP